MSESELLQRLDAIIEKLERLEKKKENPRKPRGAKSRKVETGGEQEK